MVLSVGPDRERTWQRGGRDTERGIASLATQCSRKPVAR